MTTDELTGSSNEAETALQADSSMQEEEVEVAIRRMGEAAAGVLAAWSAHRSRLRQVDEERRRGAERFRRYFEMGVVGMAITSPDKGWLEVNDCLCRILGYSREELTTRTWSELTHPDDLEAQMRLFQRVEAGEIDGYTIEKRFIRKDGSVAHALVSSRCLRRDDGGTDHHVSMIQDISERKHAEAEREKLERQLQRAQRLQSLGVLAGGIAHDFNNLLVGIMGNTSLALELMPVDAPARDLLLRVEGAARRATDLTAQLLAYSGKGKFMVGPVALSQLAREVVDLLSVSIPANAELVLELAEALPYVEADPTQIRQVVMNLITNAADALDDRAGRITLRTGSIDADAAYLETSDLSDDVAPGEYVYLEVSDTGAGMNEQTRTRIFDPFFTTKFTGRGLGLAAVLGIVRGHRGAIKVETAPDSGTTIRVLLPVTRYPEANESPESAPASPGAGRRAVLVVDDEDIVRTMVRSVLERAGMVVLAASGGNEALELLRARPGQIHAILLDISMPGMSGDEVLREIRALEGSIPVILSSGYSEKQIVNQFSRDARTTFIQKPYRADVLVEKVRGVLEANRPDSPRAQSE